MKNVLACLIPYFPSQYVTISFPAMFSTQSENCIPIFNIYDIISLFAVELEESKIGI